ncbi:monovalent cation/H+ antiporter complex subunit F [Clostridium sp. DL1XJH146]
MFLTIIMVSIALLGAFVLVRLIRASSVWDRILGLNLFSAKITMLIVLYALYEKESFFLDIAIVYALLGFISIIFISRFIRNKGKI